MPFDQVCPLSFSILVCHCSFIILHNVESQSLFSQEILREKLLFAINTTSNLDGDGPRDMRAPEVGHFFGDDEESEDSEYYY